MFCKKEPELLVWGIYFMLLNFIYGILMKQLSLWESFQKSIQLGIFYFILSSMIAFISFYLVK